MKLPEHPPISDAQFYEIGDRVKLSQFGKSRSPKSAEFGVVVSVRRAGRSVVVRFDGNKTSTPIHASYIEPAMR